MLDVEVALPGVDEGGAGRRRRALQASRNRQKRRRTSE
jgi:hypothetical protein